MSLVTLPNLGPDPFTVNASALNGKVDPLATDYNGNIQNVNIASGAGIVYSKLTLTDGILNADINSAAAIAATKLNLTTIAQTMAYSGVATNWAKGADIASATTTDIGAATGNYIDVTGTTTITGLGTVQAGTIRFVRFTGALTLTHSGTALLLPTAANITTVANDTAAFVSLGSGNWKCLWYQRYDGTSLVGATAATALSGSVIQTVETSSGTYASLGTTDMVLDNTIPQNTEGNAISLDTAITPNNSSNLIKITVVLHLSTSSTDAITIAAIFQDSTASALAAAGDVTTDAYFKTLTFNHWMTAGTTSATTFKVRAGSVGGRTVLLNGTSTGGAMMGGVLKSRMIVEEIKA